MDPKNKNIDSDQNLIIRKCSLILLDEAFLSKDIYQCLDSVA
jgi:hypothetical protein